MENAEVSANQLYKRYKAEKKKAGEKYLSWKDWINEEKMQRFSESGQIPVDKVKTMDVRKILDGMQGMADRLTDEYEKVKDQTVNKKNCPCILILATVAGIAAFILLKEKKA